MKKKQNPTGLSHTVQNHLENGIKNMPSNGCGFSFLGIVLSGILFVSSCYNTTLDFMNSKFNPKKNVLISSGESEEVSLANTIPYCHENCSIDGVFTEN